jgi:hypothetical protein
MNHCGCTITEPHSHAVYGYQCECEKGRANPKDSLTYAEPAEELKKRDI